MTISQYVTALAWLSVFGAVWYSWVNNLWRPYGIFIIGFSLVIAFLGWLITIGEELEAIRKAPRHL